VCFWGCENADGAPRPGRGEGGTVRGGATLSCHSSRTQQTSWTHAKPRSREGNGRVWRSDQCDGLSFSPFHFLASTHYGVEAMAPSPRPLSPVSRGQEGRIVCPYFHETGNSTRRPWLVRRGALTVCDCGLDSMILQVACFPPGRYYTQSIG
jgi:hypothetical protein